MSNPAIDELTQLQQEIKTYLLTKNYFSDAAAATPRPIGIVLDDEKDIDSRISLLTTKAGGLAVLITTPAGQNDFPNQYPANYDKATVVLRVFEKPIVNRGRTGLGEAGGKVAHAIYKTLHQVTLPMGCLLLSMERAPGNDPRFQTHDVFIETKVVGNEDEPVRSVYLTDELGNRLTEENSDTLIDA